MIDDSRHNSKIILNDSGNFKDSNIKTYILYTKSKEYYCGKTNNIKRRMLEHKKEKYPHWFCNEKRKNFTIIKVFDFDIEKKIKSFGVKLFLRCLLS